MYVEGNLDGSVLVGTSDVQPHCRLGTDVGVDVTGVVQMNGPKPLVG